MQSARQLNRRLSFLSSYLKKNYKQKKDANASFKDSVLVRGGKKLKIKGEITKDLVCMY